MAAVGTGSATAEALAAATDALAAAGVPEARLDAEVLLAHASGRGRASLIADPGAELPPAVGRLFGELVRRRLRREPVAYIVGTKGFRRIELEVDRRVLVPRPETELLVEVALERRPGRVLDVGTGSGAIALAVAEELPEAAVVATDTSPGALAVARANAERLGLADRVRFEAGTLPAGERFDLVLANLPYVAERDWAGLEPEVNQWEPREALLAGEDGLDAYRELLAPMPEGPAECLRSTFSDAPAALDAVSAIAVEIGAGQAVEVAELMRDAGFVKVEVRADLAGIDRVVVGGAVSAGTPQVVPLEHGGAAAARSALERTIATGGVAIFPSDGVYGLACDPLDPAAISRIHRLKGRDDGKPAAVMYFSPLAMRELVADLGPRAAAAVSALLPGPVTLVVKNRGHRYPLACREDVERLGVRLLAGPLGGAMCPVFQTSANLSGKPAPSRFEEVPDSIRAAVDLAIDGGRLGGLPSTVVDIAAIDDGGGWEILRQGAISEGDLASALATVGLD